MTKWRHLTLAAFLLLFASSAVAEIRSIPADKELVRIFPKGSAIGGQFASGGGPNWSSTPNWGGLLIRASAKWGAVGSPGVEAIRIANLDYGRLSGAPEKGDPLAGTFREPKTITELHDLQLKGLGEGFKELETKAWGKLRVPRTPYVFPHIIVVLAHNDDETVHQALVAIDEKPYIIINTNRDRAALREAYALR